MTRIAILVTALGLGLAAPALAQPDSTAGSSREIQSAVDGYLAGRTSDASLVGGPGSAGYDAGFWIRGGDFTLRINLTLQARYEAFDWDEPEPGDVNAPFGAGDLSGFSLPRALVKFSGTAPCNMCYYVELDFGHFGRDYVDDLETRNSTIDLLNGDHVGPEQSENFDNTREAWIEWCSCESFNIRMGQILTPNTRQLMTPPELQQFVDISLASAATGYAMPGYTDRNRDHGVMVHGAFGCNGEWSYMVAVTNGDGGDSIRNVIDDQTNDNLALSGRVNWAFLKPIYYEEGALRQTTCEWYGEVGAWAHYYAERSDKPHRNQGDRLTWGVDLAMGYGGFSFTGAFTMANVSDGDTPGVEDIDATTMLLQLGYLFPGTAWEIAARWSALSVEQGSIDGSMTEIAGVVNYYLNGHGNKLSLDVTALSEDDDDFDMGVFDVYTGIQPLYGPDNSALLIRFQWQLAL